MYAVSMRGGRGWKAALVLALVLGAGCSLVSIDTHVTPLPKSDLQARLLTREFATGMVSKVERSADAVAGGTSDVQVQLAAIRWKLGTSAAARRAALRTDPGLSLVDTWALACQMDQYLRAGAGRTLFGEQQATATDVTGELVRQITAIARAANPTGDGAAVERFVLEYVAKYPLVDLEFQREPIYPHWAAFRSSSDTMTTTVGTPAEVMADVADRLTLYGNQLDDEFRWRLELLAADPKYDTKDIRTLAEHLDTELNRIAAVAEQSPDLARESLQNLRETVVPVIAQFDQRWQDTLETFTAERIAIAGELTSQREALTAALKEERTAVMAETDRIATELTERAFARARVVLRELMIGACVFALIVLGVPFGLGYLAGRGFRRGRATAERA